MGVKNKLCEEPAGLTINTNGDRSLGVYRISEVGLVMFLCGQCSVVPTIIYALDMGGGRTMAPETVQDLTLDLPIYF